MVVRRNEIDAAIVDARLLLFAMAGFVVLMVFVAGYFAAHQLTQPLRRLRTALDDIANGNAAFRLSHKRRDEFGTVFDAFNRLAAAVEDSRQTTVPVAAMDMTRIGPALADKKVA